MAVSSRNKPRSPPFRLRFTIGQMMLVVMVSGLAMAPVTMYLQKARIELIVATVASETIGLPVVTTLFLMATMEPGKARTRRILILCALPTLLIGGAIVVTQVSVMVGVFGLTVVEVCRGNLSGLPIMAILWGQAFFYAWMFLPRPCPACRRFRLRRLTTNPPAATRQRIESFECKECGARSSRIRTWRGPGRLMLEAGSAVRSDVLLEEETHDS